MFKIILTYFIVPILSENETKTNFCLGMNPEAIQRVAQNLPTHMMQTLSAVANQTPHYPHTPGGAYGAANYINTVCNVTTKLSF